MTAPSFHVCAALLRADRGLRHCADVASSYVASFGGSLERKDSIRNNFSRRKLEFDRAGIGSARFGARALTVLRNGPVRRSVDGRTSLWESVKWRKNADVMTV